MRSVKTTRAVEDRVPDRSKSSHARRGGKADLRPHAILGYAEGKQKGNRLRSARFRECRSMGARPRKRFPSFAFVLPDWLESAIPAADQLYATPEDRMALAIRLAEFNVKEGTGGPFGAAVFNLQTFSLVAAGVNLVLRSKSSIAHAEVIAISLAQRILDTHDLGAPGMPRTELVTSCEPCAMCLGAVTWAGIRSLVCGAREDDARAIGFDEGPKLDDWVNALEARGIRVSRDVKRAAAVSVLQAYRSSGGLIYNGRSGSAGR
jgi:tRNA(Arg) A34 adenosine deaminase TadA